MNKTEKQAFLRKGGSLIRHAHNRDGKPIIKARTNAKDWHEIQCFDSVEIRDKAFASLLKYTSGLYVADE
jgi:hypothetical protein